MIAPPGSDYDGHVGEIVFSNGKLNALGCRTCGYAHLTPLPTQEELDGFYDHVYQSSEGLLEQELGQQWYWGMVYRARMREFERLNQAKPVHGFYQAVLDYGAGAGRFVDYVQFNEPDWNVRGYEPNFDAVYDLISNGVLGAGVMWSAIPGTSTGTFHAVHCSLVLEHVRDPLAVLREIHDLLVPGGVACIVVPNEFNPLQVKLYDRGYSPLHLTHVNYFTPSSLTWLVKQAGFEVVRRTVTFPMEWFALHGLDYVCRPRLGAVAHWLRMRFDAALIKYAPEVRREMRDGWAERGIGREIELWVRRSV